jgi:hypothetical protein
MMVASNKPPSWCRCPEGLYRACATARRGTIKDYGAIYEWQELKTGK